jgi:hypothetical protein
VLFIWYSRNTGASSPWTYWAPFILAGVALLLGVPVYNAQRRYMTPPEPVITHGNGFATLYTHLSAIDVSGSQPVQRGQQIANEGSIDVCTDPHLHFEIRLNGAYQNPLS